MFPSEGGSRCFPWKTAVGSECPGVCGSCCGQCGDLELQGEGAGGPLAQAERSSPVLVAVMPRGSASSEHQSRPAKSLTFASQAQPISSCSTSTPIGSPCYSTLSPYMLPCQCTLILTCSHSATPAWAEPRSACALSHPLQSPPPALSAETAPVWRCLPMTAKAFAPEGSIWSVPKGPWAPLLFTSPI